MSRSTNTAVSLKSVSFVSLYMHICLYAIRDAVSYCRQGKLTLSCSQVLPPFSLCYFLNIHLTCSEPAANTKLAQLYPNFCWLSSLNKFTIGWDPIMMSLCWNPKRKDLNWEAERGAGLAFVLAGSCLTGSAVLPAKKIFIQQSFVGPNDVYYHINHNTNRNR